MAGFLDAIAQLLGKQPGSLVGLPELSGGFQDYGPWGAGGGPLGPGPFPAAPAPISMETAQAAAQQAEPFARAVQAAGPTVPSAASADVTVPQTREYSRLLDPSRGGFLSLIGSMTGAPTRAEAQASREGAYKSAAIQEVERLRASGMTAQQAIMQVLNSKLGMEWLMTPGANAIAELNNYVTATKTPVSDVKVVNGQVVREKTPGKGDYVSVFDAPMSPAEKAQQDIAAQRLELDKQKAAQEATTATLTPDQKDYDRAVSEFKAGKGPDPGSYSSWHAATLRLAGPTGDMPPAALQETAVKLSAAADAARSRLQDMATIGPLLKQSETNITTPMTLPIREAFRALGIDVTEGDQVPLQETLRAFTNRFALELRQGVGQGGNVGMPGNMSDADRDFLVKSGLPLGNTKEANMAQWALFTAAARRDALLSSAKAEYIWEHKTLQGWDKYSQDLIDKNPYFTQEERAIIGNLNPKRPSPDIAPERFGRSSAPGETDRLPPPPPPSWQEQSGQPTWEQTWGAMSPDLQARFRAIYGGSNAPQ